MMMMMKPREKANVMAERENGRKLNYKQSVITNWPFLSTSLDAYVAKYLMIRSTGINGDVGA